MPSVYRKLRNKLRLSTPSVLLWIKPSRDSRVRLRTSWWMWRANGLAANLDKKQRNFDKVIPLSGMFVML